MTTQEQLVARLRPLGIRLTPQRLAIAEVVVNSADHPSVKEIYERVKAFFPYVTIATLYSTLTMLEQAGIVRELPFQRQSRYDANLDPHANLVCLGCGMPGLRHGGGCRGGTGNRGRVGCPDVAGVGLPGGLPAGGFLRLVLPLHPGRIVWKIPSMPGWVPWPTWATLFKAIWMHGLSPWRNSLPLLNE